MSEIERLLRQEQAEQKRIARGSRCKKNGSKSKHCSLPSDNLSRKEKAALSGPVTIYDGTIVPWETFVSMPMDEKIAFISRMQYLYKMDMFMLSSAWGLDMSYLVKKLAEFSVRLDKVFPTKEDRGRFARMIKKMREMEQMKNTEPKYIGKEQFIALTPEERTLYVSKCMQYFQCGQRTLFAYILHCTFNQARKAVDKYGVVVAPEVANGNLHTTKTSHQKLIQWSGFDAKTYSTQSSPADEVKTAKKKPAKESKEPNPEQLEIVPTNTAPTTTQPTTQEESTMVRARTASSSKKLSGEIEYTGTIQEAIEMLQHLSNVSKEGQVMLLINL